MPSPIITLDQISALFEHHVHTKPTKITQPQTAGVYSLIYLVTLPSIPHGYQSPDFFLRLAKPTHPTIKTRNEIGWLKFAKTNADDFLKDKIPRVLFWSDSTDELGYEYNVLEKLPGATLGDIWEDVEPETLAKQVVDVALSIRELTLRLPKSWFGGLQANGGNGELEQQQPGPYVEYTSYDTEHIQKYWAGYPETFETLNLMVPFDTLGDYWAARLQRDIHVIKTHRGCEALRGDFLETLEGLPPMPNSLQALRPHIAHRDLVLPNLLWDQDTNQITGVLDWEFAGMYTISDWSPGNTLAAITPAKRNDGRVTQEKLFEALDNELKTRNVQVQDKGLEEGSLGFSWKRIVSLNFWIVERHVEGRELGEGERVQGWIEEWREHVSKVMDS